MFTTKTGTKETRWGTMRMWKARKGRGKETKGGRKAREREVSPRPRPCLQPNDNDIVDKRKNRWNCSPDKQQR